MISARNLMVLFDIYLGGPTSGEGLASKYAEGREAMRSALRYLKTEGYLKATKSRLPNGHVVTTTELTELGYQILVDRRLVNRSPETRLQNNLYDTIYNSPNIPNIPNIINNHPTKSDEEKYEVMKVEVKEMGYEFFDKTSSEDDSDSRKAAKVRREEKAADYREKVSRKVSKFKSRFGVPVEDWTPTDLSFEFADRLNLTMKLPPWNVSTTPLAAAISKSQQKMEISNDDVCTLIDRFFKSFSIKPTDNADMLWKMFIKYVYANASDVKNLVKENYEVTEEDRLRTARAMERFLGDV